MSDLTQASMNGKVRDQAAKAVGASNGSAAKYSYVKKHAPDLAKQVQDGDIYLDSAYRQAQERVRVQPKPEPVAPKPTIILRTHEGYEG